MELRNFRDTVIEKLKNQEYAKTYIAVALDEYEQHQNPKFLLNALRIVAEAQGGLTQLAARSKLNRQHLYRILSAEGNPRLNTVDAILRALGFRLSVEFLNAPEALPSHVLKVSDSHP